MQQEKKMFEEFLREKELKLTHQRFVILDAFLKEERHVSVEDLYKVAKKKDARIGQTTVFRTLKFNVHREFNRIRDRATLDDGSLVPFFRMKDLRSTAGTDAADEQFSEFNVASCLGHSDSKVTAMHYVKRKLDAKRQIAEVLASKLNIA